MGEAAGASFLWLEGWDYRFSCTDYKAGLVDPVDCGMYTLTGKLGYVENVVGVGDVDRVLSTAEDTRVVTNAGTAQFSLEFKVKLTY